MKYEHGAGRPLKVVGLPGSLREGSYTRLVVEIALQGASEFGAETTLLDLRDFDLPFCDGGKNNSEGVVRLRQIIGEADGIIVGTPDYHGSYSGVLKNALDLMGADEFRGKMIGLISVGGGAVSGINALNELRSIFRSLHAWSVPQQGAVGAGWNAFDEAGQLKSRDLEERVKGVGRQVVQYAHLHNTEQARELFGVPSNK